MNHTITNLNNAVVLQITNASGMQNFENSFAKIYLVETSSWGRLGYGELTAYINDNITLTSPIYNAEIDRNILIERIENTMTEWQNGQ